jgi:hypothetical protein
MDDMKDFFELLAVLTADPGERFEFRQNESGWWVMRWMRGEGDPPTRLTYHGAPRGEHR